MRSVTVYRAAGGPLELQSFEYLILCYTGQAGLNRHEKSGKRRYVCVVAILLVCWGEQGALEGSENGTEMTLHAVGAVVEATFRLAEEQQETAGLLLQAVGIPKSLHPAALNGELVIRREIQRKHASSSSSSSSKADSNALSEAGACYTGTAAPLFWSHGVHCSSDCCGPFPSGFA